MVDRYVTGRDHGLRVVVNNIRCRGINAAIQQAQAIVNASDGLELRSIVQETKPDEDGYCLWTAGFGGPLAEEG